MKKIINLAVPALIAGAIVSAPPAQADTVMCPDGQEGVIGPTTCEFAQNVRAAYYGSGSTNTVTGAISLVAFSPITGERYDMTCVSEHPAYCTGGSDAEVVVY
jgi:hypothetical protein